MRGRKQTVTARSLLPRIRLLAQGTNTAGWAINTFPYFGVNNIGVTFSVGHATQLQYWLQQMLGSGLVAGGFPVAPVGTGTNPSFTVRGSRVFHFQNTNDASIHTTFYWCKPKYDSLIAAGFQDADIEAVTFAGTTDQFGTAQVTQALQHREPEYLEAFNDRWRIIKKKKMIISAGAFKRIVLPTNFTVNGDEVQTLNWDVSKKYTTQLMVKCHGQLCTTALDNSQTGFANGRIRWSYTENVVLKKLNSFVDPYLVMPPASGLGAIVNAEVLGNIDIAPVPIEDA